MTPNSKHEIKSLKLRDHTFYSSEAERVNSKQRSLKKFKLHSQWHISFSNAISPSQTVPTTGDHVIQIYPKGYISYLNHYKTHSQLFMQQIIIKPLWHWTKLVHKFQPLWRFRLYMRNIGINIFLPYSINWDKYIPLIFILKFIEFQ